MDVFTAWGIPVIGQTLGRYRIVELIGADGMGVVYRAHDPTLDGDVALKVLHPHSLDSEVARDDFVGKRWPFRI